MNTTDAEEVDAVANHKITMKPAKRGAHIPMGKGWRLVTPSRTRYFKVTVLAAPDSLGKRYVMLRVH